MRLAPHEFFNEFFIDLEAVEDYWNVMIIGHTMGMYSVVGSLKPSWENTLMNFLDEKLGIV